MVSELTPAQHSFRAAMASLSAAVNIVTTNGPRGEAGVTVSAVSSVTDSPPTLLVCVNRSSYTHDVFQHNRHVAINVLASDQEEIAWHFAGRTGLSFEERFALPIWDRDHNGVPLLKEAAARVSGTIVDETSRGSHSVFFVEVDTAESRDDRGGLAYFQRNFHALSVA